MKLMESKTRKKQMKAVAVFVLFTLYLAAALTVKAGQIKTGGTYDITDDSMTAAGRADVTGGSYWLLFSAGQPAGQEDMAGGTYSLEGGFVSGVIPVFQVTKTITNVETPAGYTGNPTDQVPGGRLTYKIEFENFGEGANNALIEDAIPAFATYSPVSIVLTLNNTPSGQSDDKDGDPCAYMAATTSVSCLIPGVGAGATGAVIFKAIIK